ncbi:hypothetical protein ASZ90_011809 [hydrocarbon metagenome]|uniref:Uncharacterized protein n=1 Tax=hydrocarbon metagenome TaxID=938273 RepID=A0A0W8FC59_9ZZZZ
MIYRQACDSIRASQEDLINSLFGMLPLPLSYRMEKRIKWKGRVELG